MGGGGLWQSLPCIILPAFVTEKIRKLACKFIRDSRKGTLWPKMILSKKEGGLWVINTKPVNLPIKRAAKFWERSPSILSTWIQKRYIKGKALSDIQVKPSQDSAQWKSLLSAKEDIDVCLECGAPPSFISMGPSLECLGEPWLTQLVREE